jgi:dihydroorotase-like cyclic amidohydrolase
LAAVERARRRGVALWVETCPQYLLMDDDTLRRHGTMAKIAPPLRSKADRRALATALATGAINTVGSDHASHAVAAKESGKANIFEAAFGMPGSPVLWPAMYSWAVEQYVPLPIVVRAMSETPARLFGLGHRKGHLAPGADADLIVVDPAARRSVDAETFWPKVASSPLAGTSLMGWPEITISRGEVICRDGEVLGTPGRAQFIPQKR